MNINKLKKLNNITMMLNDGLKTAPPMYHDAIKMVIIYLIEEMENEVDDE